MSRAPHAVHTHQPAHLLALTQGMLEDVPVGLLLADLEGLPLWFNHEAAIVCAVWNFGERRAAALRLSAEPFVMPVALKTVCDQMHQRWRRQSLPHIQIVSDHDRGLHARIKLQPPAARRARPAFYIQLDYRRPRGDRDRPLSPGTVALLNRLTAQEREVAMRLREGLSNIEIATELHRSPLTIKTQLANIFPKLGARNRAHLIALLNR